MVAHLSEGILDARTLPPTRYLFDQWWVLALQWSLSWGNQWTYRGSRSSSRSVIRFVVCYPSADLQFDGRPSDRGSTSLCRFPLAWSRGTQAYRSSLSPRRRRWGTTSSESLDGEAPRISLARGTPKWQKQVAREISFSFSHCRLSRWDISGSECERKAGESITSWRKE